MYYKAHVSLQKWIFTSTCMLTITIMAHMLWDTWNGAFFYPETKEIFSQCVSKQRQKVNIIQIHRNS